MLFMLGLLEAGSVALLLAFLLLSGEADGFGFAPFGTAAATFSPGVQFILGVLLLLGFGAKLGLLPFYEWFPGAYGAGSGASGVILSGIVLNAAFFGLSRGLLEWLPPDSRAVFYLSVVVIAVGVISAILAIFYAFQEDDWRELLSFSTAENAAIAVTALGVALLFRLPMPCGHSIALSTVQRRRWAMSIIILVIFSNAWSSIIRLRPSSALIYSRR